VFEAELGGGGESGSEKACGGVDGTEADVVVEGNRLVFWEGFERGIERKVSETGAEKDVGC
jgi:hypothetical protein